MQQYGLYVIGLGFASGVALGSLFYLSVPVAVWLLLVALTCLCMSGRLPSRYPYRVRYLVLAIVCVALGIVRMDVARWHEVSPVLEPKLAQSITVSGVVVREPDVRERTQHLYVQLPGEARLLLVMADRFQPISYGDTLFVTGTLEKPEQFETELGRTFDYPGFLQARNVSYLIRYPEELSVTARGDGNVVVGWLLAAKEQFQTGLRQVLGAPSVYLAEGILLGEKQALGEQWEELFRRTGVIHIVVLSGFNVMLVVSFMLFVLSYLTGIRGRVAGGLLGIAAFVCIVGLSPSVTRAGFMAGIVLAALLLGRSYAILRALVLAGVVMIAVNPYVLLYDPGFQLSFMATLGLIVVAPYFEERLTLAPARLGIRSYIVATIATQLAVLPLLLYQIGEVSLVAVLANVLVLPAVPAAMALAFATGVVSLVSTTLAIPLALLTELSLQYVLWVVAFLGNWSLAAVPVPYFPVWMLLVSYAALGYWWYRRTQRLAVFAPYTSTDTTTGVDISEWTIDEVIDDKTGATRRVAPVPTSMFNP